MTGEVGDREEEIADLVGDGVPVALAERLADLEGFLRDLRDDGARVVPVEPDGRRFGLELDGAGQAGEGDRDIVEQAGDCLPFARRAALLRLDRVPRAG